MAGANRKGVLTSVGGEDVRHVQWLALLDLCFEPGDVLKTAVPPSPEVDSETKGRGGTMQSTNLMQRKVASSETKGWNRPAISSTKMSYACEAACLSGLITGTFDSEK